MKKFKASYGRIVGHEVVKETEKQIVYIYNLIVGQEERRESKVSHGIRWFDTWEEAHEFLKQEIMSKIGHAQNTVERLKGEYIDICGMEKPE